MPATPCVPGSPSALVVSFALDVGSGLDVGATGSAVERALYAP
ncbi:hypothetical protein [Streptomyces sp. NPDC057676]